jgi:hypothetical protein
MHRTSLFVVVSISLLGCNGVSMSPEKACSRAEKLMSKVGDPLAKDKDRCVTDLARLKKEAPAEYGCTAKCLGESSIADEAKACVSACKPASSGEAEAQVFAVDTLTPANLKDKLTEVYKGSGLDITGEKDGAKGWSATVEIGNGKAPRGEAHVYKVHLVDVKDRKEGFEAVANLRKANHLEESRVGKQKALVVRCVTQRSAIESGKPRACASFDSKIAAFTNDLAAQ